MGGLVRTRAIVPETARRARPRAPPVTAGPRLRHNSAMRDVFYGAVGALVAYGAYKLGGHPVWALVAMAAYTPLYLKLRDRLPAPRQDRASD